MSKLLGVSDGFALFGSDAGLTVVVNLSNLAVYDPVPQVSIEFSRWSEPDPALVPTEAFGLADSALGTAALVEGTDVIVAGGKSDKRSFAIPKAAQAEAQKGLKWYAEHHRGGTDVSLNMARMLAKGGPIGIQKVQHIGTFFDRHQLASKEVDGAELSDERIMWALWGGDSARRWASNIVKREQDLAVLTGLDFEPDPEPEMEPVEEFFDSSEPHEYLPDAVHGYACETCGQEEMSLVHVVPSDETITAAAGTRKIVDSETFFNLDVDLEDAEPDFYVDIEYRADGIPSMATALYAITNGDEWVQWSVTGHNWASAAEQSEAVPIDPDSAYELAVLFDTSDGNPVPVSELDVVEWELAHNASDVIAKFEQTALEDLEFCVVLKDSDSEDKVHGPVIVEIFFRDPDNDCWRWNPVDVTWELSLTCPDDCTKADYETAREAALRLAHLAITDRTPPKRGDQTRFTPQPESASRLGPKLVPPRGPFMRFPSRGNWMFEFDRAFSRAAWIIGLSGPRAEFMAPGNTATSFSIMELAPGDYTPEERSENASKQLRDANGRFVQVGGAVHIKSNRRTAKIVRVNQDKGTVIIEYADGTTQERPVADVVNIGESQTGGEGSGGRTTKINPDDYASDPRATKITPKAWLDKLLPAMDSAELKKVFDDYAAYIEEMRKRGKVDFTKFAALTPETTDIKPLFLAQVDELDNQAVVELIALVPKTKTTSDVLAYVRAEGGWKRDDKMLARIKATTPPPLVVLDEPTYKQVLEQVDSYFTDKGKKEKAEAAEESIDSIVAALHSRMQLWDETGALIPVFEATALTAAGVPGVADTPSDVAAARKLRNYWLRGRGAAKIRWNTPGDWTRCVRHLSKYMGIRARGYCQNLHKDATGLYTGDTMHRKMYGGKGSKLLSAPTTVLASTDDITESTQFLALLELEIPTVQDMANLTYREPGHKLRIGERFLVDGGDGTYTLSVLEPTSIVGWEGEPAVLVGTKLLQEQM